MHFTSLESLSRNQKVSVGVHRASHKRQYNGCGYEINHSLRTSCLIIRTAGKLESKHCEKRFLVRKSNAQLSHPYLCITSILSWNIELCYGYLLVLFNRHIAVYFKRCQRLLEPQLPGDMLPSVGIHIKKGMVNIMFTSYASHQK